MEIPAMVGPLSSQSRNQKLAYLIRNPQRVISRERILNEVWGYGNYARTRTLIITLKSRRKKLEVEPTHPKHFHTVHSSVTSACLSLYINFGEEEKTKG